MMLNDLKMWEGCTDWMYRDTSLSGIVTVGYGFAVPSVKDVYKYRWSRDMAVVEADYMRVRAEPAGLIAGHYKPLCRARLLDADATAESKLQDLTKLLERRWVYSLLPHSARRALLDMAWNLGLGGLDKYKKLHAAVGVRDWHTASTECARRGVSAARNEWTRDRFLDALQSAGHC